MTTKTLVSIVLPVHNEAENLNLMQTKLSEISQPLENNYEFEIIYVNDGSTDQSLEILLELQKKYKEVRIIDFANNYGHQEAMVAGLRLAKGQYIITMDSDLQDPPEIIPQMLKKAETGAEIVVAKKLNYTDAVIKRFLSSLFYKLYKTWVNPKIILDAGDFRLVDQNVNQFMLGSMGKSLFLRGMVTSASNKIEFVEFTRASRNGGASSYTFKKSFNLALNGVLDSTEDSDGFNILFLGSYFILSVVVTALCAVVQSSVQNAGQGQTISSLILISIFFQIFLGLALVCWSIFQNMQIKRIYRESRGGEMYRIRRVY